MVRRCILAIALVFAGCALAQPAPSSASRAPIDPAHLDDLHQDIYAIYSLLMPGAVFTNLGPAQNEHWAIADTTISIDDMNPALAPDAALKPPDGEARPFHEAVEAFNLRKHERQTLIPAFRLDRPYILLTPSQVEEFRSARTAASPGNALAQKYAGYPGINYFSDVYFDTHRSVALVYRLDWCGNLCSQGEWIYAEKHNGRWIERSG